MRRERDPMNAIHCEKEPLVLEAVKNGRWDDDLRRHTAECAVCSEVALTASFLHAMRDEDFAEVQVPQAGRVWWRAQLQARRTAAERAVKPVTIAELAAFVCAALAFVGVCVWQWQAFSARLASFAAGWHLDSAPVQNFVVNLWQTSSTTLILGASAVLIFFLLLAYLVRTEE